MQRGGENKSLETGAKCLVKFEKTDGGAKLQVPQHSNNNGYNDNNNRKINNKNKNINNEFITNRFNTNNKFKNNKFNNNNVNNNNANTNYFNKKNKTKFNMKDDTKASSNIIIPPSEGCIGGGLTSVDAAAAPHPQQPCAPPSTQVQEATVDVVDARPSATITNNRDNHPDNWSNQNQNTGDFYGSNYSKPYHNSGEKSNYYQQNPRCTNNNYNFRDNSKYMYIKNHIGNNWKNTPNYSNSKLERNWKSNLNLNNLRYQSKYVGFNRDYANDTNNLESQCRNRTNIEKDRSIKKHYEKFYQKLESQQKRSTSKVCYKGGSCKPADYKHNNSTPCIKDPRRFSPNPVSIKSNKDNNSIQLNVDPLNSTISRHLDVPNDRTISTEIDLPSNHREKSLETNIARVPKISLIPLAKLIRHELQELSDTTLLSATNFNSKSVQNQTTTKPVIRPNLINRRRRKISSGSNSSSLTENLVDKLANMDTIEIKNIINSTGTKYDEALKVQARKRLRDEIRKQLKSMSLEKPKISDNPEFVADEIVESIHIPDVVLDEIHKAFGINLFETDQNSNKPNMKINTIRMPDVLEHIEKSPTTTPNLDPICTGSEDTTVPAHILSPSKPLSTDLMTRIKTAEHIKSLMERSAPKEHRITRLADECSPKQYSVIEGPFHDKVNHEAERDSSPKTPPTPIKIGKTISPQYRQFPRYARKSIQSKKRAEKSRRNISDIIIIDSSGSSSSSSSSTSSSSSSSSTSSSSSSSSDDSDTDAGKLATSLMRCGPQRKKATMKNVVNAFEKLILPYLSENQKQRYKEKYSSSSSMQLNYISFICTSDYNSQKFSKIEIAKIQRMLNADNNGMALQFLMREIVNVSNKQKKILRTDDPEKTNRVSEKEAPSLSRVEETAVTSNDLIKPQNISQSMHSTVESNKVEENSNRISGDASKTSPVISTSETTREKPSFVTADGDSEAIKSKSANAAEKVNADPERVQSKLDDSVSGKKNIPTSKHQSVNEQTPLGLGVVEGDADAAKTPATSTTTSVIARNQENPIKGTIAINDQNKEKDAEAARDDEKPHTKENQGPSDSMDVDGNVEDADYSEALIENSSIVDVLPETESIYQQLKSVGEKKFDEEIKTSRSLAKSTMFCGLEYETNSFSGLENLVGLSGLCSLSKGLNYFAHQPLMPPVDLDVLKHQSIIGQAVVSNLREIDVKLMELHKRKMFIEEMILKLQKDKMEADLLTIKLQNEKFILLNTAMTANATSATSSSRGPSPIPNAEKTILNGVMIKSENSRDWATNTYVRVNTKNSVVKRKSVSPPTSVKIPNQKKRCQRDVLLEYTAESQKCTESERINSQESPRSMRKRNPSNVNTSGNGKKSKVIHPRPIHAAHMDDTATPETATSCKDNTTSESPKKRNDDVQSIETAKEPPKTDVGDVFESFDDSLEDVTNDYSNVPVGNFEGIKSPVTQIRIIDEFIIAASEDGNLYKFNLQNLQLEKHFAKHSEAITQIHLCRQMKVLYSISLDGYFKKSTIKDLDLDIQSVYLEEPLQSIDIQWGVAYIGSRWGNIFTYNTKTNHLSESILCTSDSSIIALKATKEGPRKVLIVSSKGNQIHFRDATSGLLLRSLNVPENLHIFCLLLDYSCLYCGTQKNKIYKYDFTTGAHLSVMNCGNGAVSMKLYKRKFLFVGCYDGFIYVLDTDTDCQIGRFPGSGRMILALEIVGDKLISSAKDNTMQIIDIPKYIVTKAKNLEHNVFS